MNRPLLVLLATVATAAAQPSTTGLVSPVQDARLTTPGLNGSGYQIGLGYSVAFDGDRALVGAVGEDVGNTNAGTDAGAAYVFVRTASGWEQEARLVEPNGPYYYGFFGFSVALSGDRAFVTSRSYSRDLVYRGAVHVFVRSGETWSHEATLLDPERFTIFGRSVSASGDRVLVGAIKEAGGFGFDGAAHVFTRSGTTWSHEATLRANPVVRYDQLGSSVSLLGDRALVGAPQDDASGTDSGSAYLFTRAGGSWIQEARLATAPLAAGDLFGGAVSLGEDRALVGAPARTADSNPAAQAGDAYTFVRSSSGAWTLESTLNIAGSPGNDAFGYSVSLLSDRILVGAPAEAGAGRAHLFARQSGTWQYAGAVSAADGAAGDSFGFAVALSGERALIGAAGEDDADRPGAGAAYVFSGVGPTGMDGGPSGRVSLSPPRPNPATRHAELTLALDRPQYVRAVLVDALGREVALLHDGEAVGTLALRVDGGGLAPGVYVVRVVGGTFAESARLVIAR